MDERTILERQGNAPHSRGLPLGSVIPPFQPQGSLKLNRLAASGCLRTPLDTSRAVCGPSIALRYQGAFPRFFFGRQASRASRVGAGNDKNFIRFQTGPRIIRKKVKNEKFMLTEEKTSGIIYGMKKNTMKRLKKKFDAVLSIILMVACETCALVPE
jgi:hypothetical protein